MKQVLLILMMIAGWNASTLAATLKGIVKDAQTGEELIGAAVFVKEKPEIGTIAGLDGSFVLKNIPDQTTVTLVCSYISYETQEQKIATTTTNDIIFALYPSSMALEGVVIVATADKTTDNSARSLEKNAANVRSEERRVGKEC